MFDAPLRILIVPLHAFDGAKYTYFHIVCDVLISSVVSTSQYV